MNSSRKAADAATQTEIQTEAETAVTGAGSESAVASATQVEPTAAQTPQRDEHHGQGGIYQRNADGTRTLIERTERTAPAKNEP